MCGVEDMDEGSFEVALGEVLRAMCLQTSPKAWTS